MTLSVRNFHRLPEDAWIEVAQAAGNELWVASFVQHLFRYFQGPPRELKDYMEEVIEVFIVQRHDRVLFEKARLENQRIARRGSLLLYVDGINPAPHSSRLENAVSILRDLGLVEEIRDTGTLQLTADGLQWKQTMLELDNACEPAT